MQYSTPFLYGIADSSCTQPDPIANGMVVKAIHSWCDEGYTLLGNENRTCTDSGTWSDDDQPSCIR